MFYLETETVQINANNFLFKATASSALALLQCASHQVHHIRSKSASENDTEDRMRTKKKSSADLELVCLFMFCWHDC